MKREQIEKEIDARLEEPDNDWDGIFNSGYSRGFREGAQWRINSVWHNLPNDLPQKENTLILLELIFEDRLVYFPIEWVNVGVEISKQATRWAYINDLIPERKEETE